MTLAFGQCSRKEMLKLCLYKEPYIYLFQLTVILKFNQSHLMKSSKMLVLLCRLLRLLIYVPGSGATSSSAFHKIK